VARRSGIPGDQQLEQQGATVVQGRREHLSFSPALWWVRGSVMKNHGMPDAHICTLLANSLRDFGYPDVTTAMIEDILREYRAGKRGADLPHGIIGRMAEAQLVEANIE
jgi:hypothetical protein